MGCQDGADPGTEGGPHGLNVSLESPAGNGLKRIWWEVGGNIREPQKDIQTKEYDYQSMADPFTKGILTRYLTLNYVPWIVARWTSQEKGLGFQ